MKIALTLLTCDRTAYTRRTLETLAAHNDLSRFELIHGDDASYEAEGRALANAAGFRTAVQNRKKRLGVARMTELLFEAALGVGAGLILNLQNDWESVRPIPVDEILCILEERRDVYCVRLYGQWKSTTGRCGIHHGGREPRRVVEWRPLQGHEGYEIGDIHWGHPPAVTRVTQALQLVRGARAESVSRARSGAIKDLTVRTSQNVFMHIGRERTQGFVA